MDVLICEIREHEKWGAGADFCSTTGKNSITTRARQLFLTPGDVLILWTDQLFAIYGVGLVSVDGQQGLHPGVNVQYVRDREAAVAIAKAIVQPGRRIFLRNIDGSARLRLSDKSRQKVAS
jgi:hypothetical protein